MNDHAMLWLASRELCAFWLFIAGWNLPETFRVSGYDVKAVFGALDIAPEDDPVATAMCARRWN